MKRKKIIGISMRVEKVQSYNEVRDAIDEKWFDFLLACDCIPFLIPNSPEVCASYLEHYHFDGFLFTGGNDLVKYGGNAPQRDLTETLCLEYAIKNEIPLIGICRGMQFIADYFGMSLTECVGHVGNRHCLMDGYEVNSYHNFTIATISDDFTNVIRSQDGLIESFEHKNYTIFCQMWHPERESIFSQRDIDKVKSIYKV